MPMKPGSTKNLLLRLDHDLAERLQTVADVEGRSVSDLVREAITKLVEQRRRDKRFLRLLDDNLARHQQALKLPRHDHHSSPSRWLTSSSSPPAPSAWPPPT